MKAAKNRKFFEDCSMRLQGVPRKLKLTSMVLGPENRKLIICDNLLSPKELKEIYKNIKVLPYAMVEGDNVQTDHIKHLVHNFTEKEWMNSEITTWVAQVCQVILKKKGLKFGKINRVTATFNLFGDYQYTHYDGDEWTCLMFVNSIWQTDWGGELSIYDGNPHHPAMAIQPVPGRLVIFDGLLAHRGGVPSKLCFEPRIALVTKFSRPKTRK